MSNKKSSLLETTQGVAPEVKAPKKRVKNTDPKMALVRVVAGADGNYFESCYEQKDGTLKFVPLQAGTRHKQTVAGVEKVETLIAAHKKELDGVVFIAHSEKGNVVDIVDEVAIADFKKRATQIRKEIAEKATAVAPENA